LRGQANLPAARTRLLGERSAHPNLTMPMPAPFCLRSYVVASRSLLALAALAPVAAAQCTAQWDTDGDFGLNAPVWRTTMWDQDGAGPLTPRLVVAGSFSQPSFGGPSLPNFGAYDPATRTWTGLASLGGQFIEALCASPQGDLFAAAGSQVYRWVDPSWQPVGTGAGMNGPVTGLVALSNGNLLAAGSFTTADGANAVGFARWNGTTWLSTNLGVSAIGRTLALAPNGSVIASGRFTIGGVPTERVARWDGLFWTVLGAAFDQPVSVLLAVSNTDFVAGGDFTTVGTTPANRLARWSGTAWQPVGSGVDATPYALATDGSQFVVGGAFASLAGQSVGYLARWTGSSWQSYREGMDGAVRSFARLPGGDLIAAGDFTVADRVTVNYLTRWDGQRWQCVGEGRQPLPVSDVRAVLPASNGQTIVGGPFAQGFGLNYVARFDGASWQAMATGLNGQVRALHRLPNGDVLAGGDFSATYDGATSLPYLARWDGTAWSAFGNPNGSVYGIAQRANGDLFVVGYNNSVGWCAQRWDGTSWQVVGSAAAGGFARTIAIASNGDLLMGGDFGNVGNSYTGNIARWDGSSWGPLGNFYSQWGSGIASLGVAPTGAVYAVTANSCSTYLFLWDGTSWSNVFQYYNYCTYEAVMAVLPNGDAMIGTQSGSSGYLVRYSPINGSQTIGVNAPVHALTTFGLHELHIGGGFNSTPNGPAYYTARYVVPCPAQNQPAGAGCAGPSGPTTLTFDPAPWIGLTCQSRTTGLATSSFAFVTFGFSAVNLPLDSVSPLGVSNCILVPNPDVFLVLAPFAGEVSVPVSIPNSASFAGMVLHHQTVQYELDAAFTPVSLNASNAVRLVVGVY
jgi:hypothetical protein